MLLGLSTTPQAQSQLTSHCSVTVPVEGTLCKAVARLEPMCPGCEAT